MQLFDCNLVIDVFQLPTLDDVKEEMTKLTVEKLKPGQIVEVVSIEGASPKFASGPQLKTFGLVGEVIQVSFLQVKKIVY